MMTGAQLGAVGLGVLTFALVHADVESKPRQPYWGSSPTLWQVGWTLGGFLVGAWIGGMADKSINVATTP